MQPIPNSDVECKPSSGEMDLRKHHDWAQEIIMDKLLKTWTIFFEGRSSE